MKEMKMEEVKYIKIPEVSQEEYLQQIKDYLEEAEKEQATLRNKINYYKKVVYGTPNE